MGLNPCIRNIFACLETMVASVSAQTPRFERCIEKNKENDSAHMEWSPFLAVVGARDREGDWVPLRQILLLSATASSYFGLH